MIDHKIFLEQIALLADRIGRPLAAPTQRAYYDALSDSLTTEQFVAATTLAFRTWSAEFRNWPSPKQIIELIAPVENPALSALDAFESVCAIVSPKVEKAEQLVRIQALGAAAVRAFRAAGGFRDFTGMLDDELPWVRKRFVDAYEAACEGATAERDAQLALNASNDRFAALVANVANQRSMPEEPRRIAAGGGR